MTKVTVTGGAGFVGTNLIAHFAEEGGYEVTVMDNESLGALGDIDAVVSQFVRGDILDENLLRSTLAGSDVVVHLAGSTRVVESIEDPWPTFETNAIGTFRVLSACRTVGVGKVLCASTGGAIIGEADGPIHEEIMPRPMAPYGASKLAAEGYCHAFLGAYGLRASSLRFSNVFGPRSYRKASVVAHFFREIIEGRELVVYGDGNQVRDYVFVGDLVRGIRLAMESDQVGVFQLASGTPTRLLELISAIKEVVGPDHPVAVRHEPARPGEVFATWCDISKAKEQLGFHPDVPLLNGLRTTWRWFVDNQEELKRRR